MRYSDPNFSFNQLCNSTIASNVTKLISIFIFWKGYKKLENINMSVK